MKVINTVAEPCNVCSFAVMWRWFIGLFIFAGCASDMEEEKPTIHLDTVPMYTLPDSLKLDVDSTWSPELHTPFGDSIQIRWSHVLDSAIENVNLSNLGHTNN